MKIFSFPPISNKNSCVLVLGTMPGKRSLAQNQYYGHRGNQFWPILFKLFDKEISTDYNVRTNLALTNGVAVWDVLKACERESSADSDILNEVSNDFESFFANHNIKAIFHNGKNPKEFFDKYVKDVDIPQFVLPSTSPANSWFTKDEKLEEWKAILEWL